MKIIVATSSSKGSLSAERVCKIIANTIKKERSGVNIVIKPMADGGEETAEAMIQAGANRIGASASVKIVGG